MWWQILTRLTVLIRRRQWHPTPVLLPGKIPCMEEPGRLQSMGSLRVGHDWETSLSLFTFMIGEGNGNPLQYSCLENPRDGGASWAAVYGVAQSRTRLSDFTFTFHFHALEKEMATHSSVLAWRIPGTGEPGGLQSMGSHRVGHDWSDLAAAAYLISQLVQPKGNLSIASNGFFFFSDYCFVVSNIHFT